MPYVLLFLLTLVFLWRPVFTRQALLPAGYLHRMIPWNSVVDIPMGQWNALQWDALAQFYPWRLHYSGSISEGIIPFWNPHQLCGTPFAANGQSAVFYPLNLVFVLFGPVDGFTAGAVIHLFLAGLFIYMLVRHLGTGRHSSLISAVMYAFSAFMVVWLELPTFINVAAWLPLILYLSMLAVERGSIAVAAWAGVAAGLCVLAGHLQIAFYCLMLTALWWGWLIISRRGDRIVFKRSLVCAGTAMVTAVFIAAPQVLPTLELARMSHRVRDVSPEGYAAFIGNGVPLMNLITMLVPDFFGSPGHGTYWMGDAAKYTETALYVGVLGLFLMVMGIIYAVRHRGTPLFFALTALGSLLLAFGTPLNTLLYYLMPGFSALGGPNRIIILYTLAASVLAGLGADWVGGACAGPDSPACDREGKLPVWAVIPPLAIITALFVISWLLTGAALHSMAGVDISQVVIIKCRPELAVFTLVFAASVMLLFLRATGGLQRRSFLQIGFALVVLDLFLFGINYNPTAPREAIYPQTQGIKALKRIAGNGRIAVINNRRWSLAQVPHAVMPPNSAMVYGLCDVGGYDSLFPRERKERIDGILGQDSSPVENGNMVFVKHYDPGLQDLASVFVSAEPLSDQSLKLEYQGEFFIYTSRLRRPVTNHEKNPNMVEGKRYEPGSIRLGLFMMLLAVTLVSGVSSYELAGRRRRR